VIDGPARLLAHAATAEQDRSQRGDPGVRASDEPRHREGQRG
jgi:hypothetical protein